MIQTSSAGQISQSTGGEWVAVFSGGGFRGIAYAALLDRLYAQGFQFEGAVGVSVGAIAAVLTCAGLSGAEIRSFFDEDFKECLENVRSTFYWRYMECMIKLSRRLFWLPYVSRVTERLQTRMLRWTGLGTSGLLQDVGKRLQALLAERLGLSRPARFSDLPKSCAILTADLVSRKPVVFGNIEECDHDSEIVPAVVASCAVPFLFPPVQGEGFYLVDGGIICNLPIYLAKASRAMHEARIAAFLLVEHEDEAWKPRGVLSFGRRLVGTALAGTVAAQIAGSGDVLVVEIDTSGVGSFEFPLADESVERLLSSGERAADVLLRAAAQALPKRDGNCAEGVS